MDAFCGWNRNHDVRHGAGKTVDGVASTGLGHRECQQRGRGQGDGSSVEQMKGARQGKDSPLVTLTH
jgi:hypothetical protein